MPFVKTYPTAYVVEEPGSRRAVQHLLWGDFVRELGPREGGWVRVRARGEEGWLPEEALGDERLLEVYFVDIGQGDGALVVTPDDRQVMVDAGEGDNMYRFLRWRYNLRANPDRVVAMEAAVISHPDQDHYGGFAEVFGSEQFTFGTVYHNGIVERTGGAPLGRRETVGGVSLLTDVVTMLDELRAVTDDAGLVGQKKYPTLLKTAVDGGRVGDVRMLCAEDGHVPGFGPGDPVAIEVLGPVPDDAGGGRRGLRWFGDVGKTKNGHSVVLKLRYGDVTILLGGDLNIPAEHHLLRHHTGGMDPEATDPDARAALVAAARGVFRVDVAKACHHGSADFTSAYLEAVDPIVTVVSSGDEEPHCHPRPDALGAFGKHGRGERPLIFSTELSRSTADRVKDPGALRARLEELYTMRDEAETDAARAKAQGRIDAVLASLDRSVAVYGMINCRTDGDRVLMAQKLERERVTPSGPVRWDVHQLVRGDGGALAYVSKY